MYERINIKSSSCSSVIDFRKDTMTPFPRVQQQYVLNEVFVLKGPMPWYFNGLETTLQYREALL